MTDPLQIGDRFMFSFRPGKPAEEVVVRITGHDVARVETADRDRGFVYSAWVDIVTRAPVDFEALRADRNRKVQALAQDLVRKLGGDPTKPYFSTFDGHACYCACPDGPCEHDFQDWRDLPDDTGGEAVCTRCGAGAMGHDMRFAP